MRKSTFLRRASTVTRSRNSKGQFVRGEFEKAEIYKLVEALQKIGRDVLKMTHALVDYEYQLGNLVDSTACAVYVDGVLVEDTIEYATPTPISNTPSAQRSQPYAVNAGMTGRDAVDKWFRDNKTIPVAKNTVHLVAIAAMHYGYYLEEGLYYEGAPEIAVISGILDEIENRVAMLSSTAGYKTSITDLAGVGKWNL